MAQTKLPDPDAVVDEYRPGGWNARYVVIIIAMLLLAELGWLQFAYPLSALPEISAHFQTSQAVWVSSIYFLVGALVSPFVGMLADRHGKKKVITLALVIATAGLLLSAFAPNFALVLVGRVMQAPVLTFPFMLPSLTRDIFPTKTIPMAASLATTGAGLLGVPTQLLAGPVVTHLGWRATFWIAAILAVVVFVLLVAFVPESSVRQKAGRVDAVGPLLLGGGITLVLVGITFAPTLSWSSLAVLGAIGLGVISLVAWVVQARRVENPILDLDALLSAPILLTISIAAIGAATSAWFLTVLPTIALTPTEVGGLGVGPNQYTQISAVYTLASGLAGLMVGFALRRRSGAPVFLGLTILVILGFASAYLGITSVFAYGLAAFLIGVGASGGYAVAYNMIIRLVEKERQASMASAVALAGNMLTSIVGVVFFAMMNSLGTADATTGLVAYDSTAFTGAMVAPGLLSVIAIVCAIALGRKLRGRDAPSERPDSGLVTESALAATKA